MGRGERGSKGGCKKKRTAGLKPGKNRKRGKGRSEKSTNQVKKRREKILKRTTKRGIVTKGEPKKDKVELENT